MTLRDAVMTTSKRKRGRTPIPQGHRRSFLQVGPDRRNPTRIRDEQSTNISNQLCFFRCDLSSFPRYLSKAALRNCNHTILHTNETHSQIVLCRPTTERGEGRRGPSRTLVKRSENNPNTLLVDAGDVLQGTPYSTSISEFEYKAIRRSVTTSARSAITNLITASKRLPRR